MVKRLLLAIVAVTVLLAAAARQQEIVRFVVQALPSTSYEGDLAYDSATDRLYIWNAIRSAWRKVITFDDTDQVKMWPDYHANYPEETSEDSDWSTYAGTPDNAASNLSISVNTTDPISGDRSYEITKSGTATDEAIILPLDNIDDICTEGGRVGKITFNYRTDANYTNDANEQWQVYTYGSSAGSQVCNFRDNLSGALTNNMPVAPDIGQIQCPLHCDSADTAIDVALVYAGTATATVVLDVDDIDIDMGKVITAPIVTEWQSYDVNIQGSVSNPTKATTTVIDQGYWRRIGDSIEFYYMYVHTNNTGAAAGSGTYRFSLPTQCTVDTTKVELTGAGGLSILGSSAHFSTTSSNNASGFVSLVNTSDVIVIVGNAAAGDNSLGSSTYPLNDASVYISFRGTVPCQEFANSNAILSTTQADHSTSLVTAQKNSGAHGTSGSWLDVSFTELSDDLDAFDGTTFTAPHTGDFLFTGSVGLDTMTGNMGIRLVNQSATLVAGLAFQYTSASATQASFSKTLTLSKGDQVKVQAYQTSGGSVNYLVNTKDTSLEIKAQPDFSTFSVYGPYEYTEAIVGSPRVETSSFDVYVDATGGSVSLSPGTWQVCYGGSIFAEWIGGSSGYTCKVVLRDGSNNDLTGSSRLISSILDGTYSSSVTPTGDVCTEVTITATTTYKMSIKNASNSTASKCSWWYGGWTGGITDPDGEAKIWARRMK